MAAIGLVAYCLSFMPVLFVMPGTAATALVSRAVGAGDRAAVRQATAACLIVAVALAVVTLVVASTAGPWFVRLLGLPEGSSVLAIRYLAIVVPTLPLLAVVSVGVAALRGAGDMVSGLVAMSVVNLVNASASFALANGVFGLPALGWDGLAWGTVLGYTCGALFVAMLLGRSFYRFRFDHRAWRPARGELARIARVGWPAGADAVGNAACHLTFLGIVNRLGNVDAAAHSVAITIESLAFLPGSAFGVAAATLAGQFLGAGDPVRARRSVGQAALTAALFMTVAGASFFLAAGHLAAWFTGGAGKQPEVASLAASLVLIVAFVQPPLALLMVFAGGLRGAGATRPPLVVNFAGLILIRLPLAMLLAWPSFPLPGGLGTLPGCGLGVYGAWLAMATDLAFRGLAMFAVYLRSGWTRVVV